MHSKLAASKVAMSAVDDVMQKLKCMTLLEASELVKAIEDTFDVDASAASSGGMMMMAPGATAGEETAEVEEQTEFDLVLESFPAEKKIAVLKVVRSITGLGLKEVKALVEAAPKVGLPDHFVTRPHFKSHARDHTLDHAARPGTQQLLTDSFSCYGTIATWQVLKESASKADCETAKKSLEDAGATVVLK